MFVNFNFVSLYLSGETKKAQLLYGRLRLGNP